MGANPDKRNHTAEAFRPGAKKPHKAWRPKEGEKIFIDTIEGSQVIGISFWPKDVIKVSVQNPQGGRVVIQVNKTALTLDGSAP